jgi:DNA-binding transcriptional LysR family regulator
MAKLGNDTLDLKSLRCFEEMAKQASLTRAAIELGISDAAVSQRIKSLEKYLGVKLYEARGGSVRLTEAGQRTRDFAARLFDELKEFQDAIGDETTVGTVAMSADASCLQYQLPPIADSFTQAHPFARLRLISRQPGETIDLVRRNEVDLGIVPQRDLPTDIAFHAWRKFKSYILVPRGHPVARQAIPTFNDFLNKETLSRYPQVVAEIEGEDHNRVRKGLERLGLPYNVALEVGNLETVKHYVAHGYGFAVVSGLGVTAEDDAIFHIIEIPQDFESETTYGVILRKDKYMSSPLRGLLALLDVQGESAE